MSYPSRIMKLPVSHKKQRLWLVSWQKNGRLQDALEYRSAYRPTRWAQNRCHQGETFTIEEVKTVEEI